MNLDDFYEYAFYYTSAGFNSSTVFRAIFSFDLSAIQAILILHHVIVILPNTAYDTLFNTNTYLH